MVGVSLVYCFALMGAYRARQFVSGKAPFAGNCGALAKSGNAGWRELAGFLRTSRQEAVRGVGPLWLRKCAVRPTSWRLAKSASKSEAVHWL
jgi:hypothetical protein